MGPLTPGTGAAPEQTLEEQIAGLRVMAETHSLPSIREIALRRADELESLSSAKRINETG